MNDSTTETSERPEPRLNKKIRFRHPEFTPSTEVRFAVVLYGGVSLAIYINGVVQELYRMVRATAPGSSLGENPTRTLLEEDALKGSEKVYRKLGQMSAEQDP